MTGKDVNRRRCEWWHRAEPKSRSGERCWGRESGKRSLNRQEPKPEKAPRCQHGWRMGRREEMEADEKAKQMEQPRILTEIDMAAFTGIALQACQVERAEEYL